MIELARGLSLGDLRELAELETRVLAVDGGRLELEWRALRTRAGANVEDVLWWEEDRLPGFLGLYAFGAPAVEIAGMVDPAARRRGIATELLDVALELRAKHTDLVGPCERVDALIQAALGCCPVLGVSERPSTL